MITLNTKTHIAKISGKEVKIPRAEWDLLLKLGSDSGRVFSREELGATSKIDHSVDIYIHRIRNRFNNHDLIRTIPKYGYSSESVKIIA